MFHIIANASTHTTKVRLWKNNKKKHSVKSTRFCFKPVVQQYRPTTYEEFIRGYDSTNFISLVRAG